MTKRKFWLGEALTLEQHRALNLTRPMTDHPIGGLTDGRRKTCADASAVFNEPDSPVNDASIAGLAALRLSRKREPRRATHTTPETTERHTA